MSVYSLRKTETGGECLHRHEHGRLSSHARQEFERRYDTLELCFCCTLRNTSYMFSTTHCNANIRPFCLQFSRFEIPWSRYPPVDFVEDRNVTDVGRDSKVVRSGAIEIALISLSEVWHSQYLMSTSQRRRFANMRASDDVSSRTPGSTFVATISATGKLNSN
jgi:hypothetical protein